MKRIYQLFSFIAISGLMTLFVANSAEAQHRGGGGSGGHGGGGYSGGGGGGYHGGGNAGGGQRGGFSGGGNYQGGNRGGSFQGGGNRGGGQVMTAPRSNYNMAPRGGNFAPRSNYNGGGRAMMAPRGNFGYNRGGVGVRPGMAYRGGMGMRNGYYRPGMNGGARFSYRPGYRGYVGGRFYTPWRGGFYNRGGFYGRIYAPRLGFRLSVLPYGYYPFYYGPDQYFYSGGYFYQYDNNQYTVVEPPIGAEVTSLPSDAQSIVIDGQQYYESNGVYYLPITRDDGSTAYQIAGKDGQLTTGTGEYQPDPNDQPEQGYPAAPQGTPNNVLHPGDVVQALPPDTRKVKIEGEVYHVDPAGIYYHEERDQYGQKVYRVTDVNQGPNNY